MGVFMVAGLDCFGKERLAKKIHHEASPSAKPRETKSQRLTNFF
jgi:hypothetical protein